MHPNDAKGFLMIKHLRITNFRGYSHLKLSNLKRVNVIVGANASGKTALLEALHLALGVNPELYFKLLALRGLGERISLASNFDVGMDLFHNGSKVVNISYVGTPGLTRSVRIFYDTKAPMIIPLEQQLRDVETAPPLAIQWKAKNQTRTLHVILTRDGLQTVGGPSEPVSSSFFSAAVPINPVESANRFHKLSVNGNEQGVVDAMRGMFPDIADLSLGSYANSPMVYANIKGLKSKMPLGIVSAGINKLLAIFVAIFENTGRVVLVDEIENGLYYEIMPKAWDHLFRFCEANRTQLFVSTHSFECLKGLLPVLQSNENEDKFSLLQTRYENGTCAIRQLEGKYLEAALEGDVEVRGRRA